MKDMPPKILTATEAFNERKERDRFKESDFDPKLLEMLELRMDKSKNRPAGRNPAVAPYPFDLLDCE